MSMSASMHPVKKSAINIDKGNKDILAREISSEMLKQTIKDHYKRKISAQD